MTDTKTENWNAIVNEDTPTAQNAAAAAPQGAAAPLPELPLVIGRLPIKGSPSRAIIELPEPTKGVQCAAIFHNVSVLADCERPNVGACRPASKFARPLNDRQIEVEFWDGDGSVITGPGWKTSPYPGGQLETRFVQTGVPFVEIMLVAGRTIACGPCDPENYAPEYGA